MPRNSNPSPAAPASRSPSGSLAPSCSPSTSPSAPESLSTRARDGKIPTPQALDALLFHITEISRLAAETGYSVSEFKDLLDRPDIAAQLRAREELNNRRLDAVLTDAKTIAVRTLTTLCASGMVHADDDHLPLRTRLYFSEIARRAASLILRFSLARDAHAARANAPNPNKAPDPDPEPDPAFDDSVFADTTLGDIASGNSTLPGGGLSNPAANAADLPSDRATPSAPSSPSTLPGSECAVPAASSPTSSSAPSPPPIPVRHDVTLAPVPALHTPGPKRDVNRFIPSSAGPTAPSPSPRTTPSPAPPVSAGLTKRDLDDLRARPAPGHHRATAPSSTHAAPASSSPPRSPGPPSRRKSRAPKPHRR